MISWKYIYIYICNWRSHAFGEYQHAFKNFFKDELKDRKTLYTDTINKWEKKIWISKMALLQHE